ncbi:MAG: hypothetical protein E7423_01280 [Ruminococcaceae bacterium]|nr:hypothetical protein [Oscillospiraceae bacterium]
MEKLIREYEAMYRAALAAHGADDIARRVEAYVSRLRAMLASDDFRAYDLYPSMRTDKVFAVIAMCLELKEQGMEEREIIDFVNGAFETRRKPLRRLLKLIDRLPFCYRVAERWNLSDHESRVRDGSITYDSFKVTDGKIEYVITGCRYIDMFERYGIRPLCKIFCLTDEFAYAQLPRHVRFIRHSDLSDGVCCHDEIIRK